MVVSLFDLIQYFYRCLTYIIKSFQDFFYVTEL